MLVSDATSQRWWVVSDEAIAALSAKHTRWEIYDISIVFDTTHDALAAAAAAAALGPADNYVRPTRDGIRNPVCSEAATSRSFNRCYAWNLPFLQILHAVAFLFFFGTVTDTSEHIHFLLFISNFPPTFQYFVPCGRLSWLVWAFERTLK